MVFIVGFGIVFPGIWLVGVAAVWRLCYNRVTNDPIRSQVQPCASQHSFARRNSHAANIGSLPRFKRRSLTPSKSATRGRHQALWINECDDFALPATKLRPPLPSRARVLVWIAHSRDKVEICQAISD